MTFCETPQNIMDSFDLVNLVKDPTCFRQSPPSLLDVILTNKPKSFQRTTTIADADFHSTVCTTMKVHIENQTKKILHCRSYNFFTKSDFLEDLKSSGINSCESVKDPNAAIKLFTDYFLSSTDTHAPLKERHIRPNQPSFLNKKFKKATWLRKRLYKKKILDHSSQNWEAYRFKRNNVLTYDDDQLGHIFKQNSHIIRCQVQPSG